VVLLGHQPGCVRGMWGAGGGGGAGRRCKAPPAKQAGAGLLSVCNTCAAERTRSTASRQCTPAPAVQGPMLPHALLRAAGGLLCCLPPGQRSQTAP
jgi:hypothetical protein